jgi:hypothetical protein
VPYFYLQVTCVNWKPILNGESPFFFFSVGNNFISGNEIPSYGGRGRGYLGVSALVLLGGPVLLEAGHGVAVELARAALERGLAYHAVDIVQHKTDSLGMA